MRIIHKYKIYTKVRDISRYPTRILRFKRTKWLAIRKLLSRQEKFLYNNNKLIKVDFNRWSNMRYIFRNKILNRRSFLIFFNNNKRVLNKILPTSKKETTLILRDLFKHIFLLEYAVFLSGFFPSVYAAKEFIKDRKVFVNANSNIINPFLRDGDFVTIKNKNFFFEKIDKKYMRSNIYFTYNEIDYYTQSLVIIKNINKISSGDFSMSIGKYLNLNINKK